MSQDRFSRQEGLIPRDRLLDLPITVIGCGAVGRQVAIQLTAVGTPSLQLIDFDAVDESNITTQGYRRAQIGLPKVLALSKTLQEIEPEIKLELVVDRYRPRMQVGKAIFCCVDSISAREAIWRGTHTQHDFWADGRMLGEVMRILVATEPQSRECYSRSLFAQEEAQTGQCTARSTIYTASIAAGMLVHQFARWLRGQPIDMDATLNLLAGELTVGDPQRC